MRVAIVDDEPEMTGQIQKYLDIFAKEHHMEISGEVFHDAPSFLQQYDGSYELVLMDVEMPGMDGIEAARQVRQKDTRVSIMFITNMAQYAIHGYEVEAVDYVIKPIGYQDFAMKMKKALRYIYRDADRQLMLETAEGKVPVKVSHIYYVEVIRHYLNFHTYTGVYQIRGVMKEQEEMLRDYHFIRCSQSYLVNLAHVRAIRGNEVQVGEDLLPISRNKKTEFVEAFTRYVGGMK